MGVSKTSKPPLWRFGASGIALQMQWRGWRIRQIDKASLLLTPPDDFSNALAVHLVKRVPNPSTERGLRPARGMRVGRWNSFEGDRYHERLIAVRKKGWLVLFDASSPASPDWPRNLLERVSHSLVANDADPLASAVQRLAVSGFHWAYGRERGFWAEAWLSGQPECLLITGGQCILLDAEGNILSQVLAGGDVLLRDASVVTSAGVRAAFVPQASGDETFYCGFSSKLAGRVSPESADLRMAAFSLSQWKERIIRKCLRLKAITEAPLRWPVQGPWECVNTPGPQCAHMDAVVIKRPRPLFPQQFAVDFVHSADLLRVTDPRINGSYRGFGQPVTTVLRGRVATRVDGIEDNPPGKRNYATPRGNYIVVRHSAQRYSLYAHLKNGTVRCRLGQEVSADEVIGQVGNSGNSTIPHLHFQLSRGEDPFSQESIPFLLQGKGLP